MSKSIQELINKFNSKSSNDNIQNPQKGKDQTEFNKRKSDFIHNDSKIKKEESDIQIQNKKSMSISFNTDSNPTQLKKAIPKEKEKEKETKLEIIDDDVYTFNEKDFIKRRYDKDNVESGKKFFKLRFLKNKLDSINTNLNILNKNNKKKDDSQINVEKERYLRQYNSDFILTLEKSILSFNVKNYKDSCETLKNSGIIKSIKEYGEFLLVVGGFDKYLIGEFLAKQKYPNDKKDVLMI